MCVVATHNRRQAKGAPGFVWSTSREEVENAREKRVSMPKGATTPVTPVTVSHLDSNFALIPTTPATPTTVSHTDSNFAIKPPTKKGNNPCPSVSTYSQILPHPTAL